MSCPTCGCKVTYSYDDGIDCIAYDDGYEVCASCGSVFHGLDSVEDYDDFIEPPNCQHYEYEAGTDGENE